MTDPTSTPPTVGQPPVAEGGLAGLSNDDLLLRFAKAAYLIYRDPTPEMRSEYEMVGNAMLSRMRLAQARSAPPSEGMVLVSRTDMERCIQLASENIHVTGDGDSFGDSEPYYEIYARLNSAMNPLVAPSGAHDVE